MRSHQLTTMTAVELERARRELAASLALTRDGSPMRGPTEAQLSAIDAEVAERDNPCHWAAQDVSAERADVLRRRP